jgi:tetratricopeptide (TPR) repeat protein
MTAGLLRENSTKALISLLLFIAVINTCWSQTTGCKNNWPTDKAKAEEQLSVYNEAIKQKNYRAATPGIQWFLKNAPNWNTKLYTDAEEVYNKLAASEKIPAKKQVLVDSLMWLYDQQVKQCGDEVGVLNRKATHAAIYNAQKKDKTAEVLTLFDKVIDISGTDVSDNILDSYFRIVYSNSQLLHNLTDEQILAHYKKIQAAIDKKIAWYERKNRSAEVGRLKVSKRRADELLPLMASLDAATASAREMVVAAKSPAEKAEALIAVGSIQAKKDPAAARESFKQAATTDPSNKDAWEKIGDLYASATDCKKRQNTAQDRLIYLAAYEMYAKAGSNRKMSTMKGMFPSKNELGGINWKEGDFKPVGCWIGDTVILKTRD